MIDSKSFMILLIVSVGAGVSMSPGMSVTIPAWGIVIVEPPLRLEAIGYRLEIDELTIK